MSRKTEFASSWWAQRWIRLLERFGWSARLNRGRSYARHGNVLDIDVQPGLVRSRVQGSRKQPYRVEIGLKPLSRGDWNKVFTLLRRKAIYAARLLSGEMPRDIEEIFKAAEVPLFPQSGDDLIMSCTCPDWASPCKHVAAVYYVLGSEFDRDPFLLFELRGRSKEQVMAAMRGTRPERVPKASAPRVSSEPLEDHLADFWEAGEELDDITIRVTPPPVPQAILKRLGPVPLVDLPAEWHGDLARMYEVVSKDALAFVHVSGKAPSRVPRMNPELNGSNGNGTAEEPEPVYTEAGAEGAEVGEAEETAAEAVLEPARTSDDAVGAVAQLARSEAISEEMPEGALVETVTGAEPMESAQSSPSSQSRVRRRTQTRRRPRSVEESDSSNTPPLDNVAPLSHVPGVNVDSVTGSESSPSSEVASATPPPGPESDAATQTKPKRTPRRTVHPPKQETTTTDPASENPSSPSRAHLDGL